MLLLHTRRWNASRDPSHQVPEAACVLASATLCVAKMSGQCVGDRRQSQGGVVVINTSLGRDSFPIPVQMSESNFPISYTLTVATDTISKFPNGAIPRLTPSRLTDSVTFSLCFFLFHQSIFQVAAPDAAHAAAP